MAYSGHAAWQPPMTDMMGLINDASEEMELAELVKMENFALLDAMSAIEIMDPRMDSGAVMPENRVDGPTFDPYTSLLPAEICWIIDRMFAAEECRVSWHSGYALPQTIYTLLYMHELSRLHPDWYSAHRTHPKDPARPDQLMTKVLRAAIFGLVKCCDLICRELMKNNLYDGEDFSIEKNDVSLYEGTAVANVMDMLTDALAWLEDRPGLSYRKELQVRLSLRMSLLNILAHHSNLDSTTLSTYVTEVQDKLELITTSPPTPTPSPISCALAAFDPSIHRTLVSNVPIKSIELPSQDDTWTDLAGLIAGMDEVFKLKNCLDMTVWKTVLSLRACVPPTSRRGAYVRAITMSTFVSSGQPLVLGTMPPRWLVDKILFDIARVPEDTITRLWHSSADPDAIVAITQRGLTLQEAIPLFEEQAASLVIHYISTLCHNRPRQRRNFSKTLWHWCDLSDIASDMASVVAHESEGHFIRRIPLVIAHLQFTLITEVVFSGFEMDLYDVDEWAPVYWYAAQNLESQNQTLESLSEFLEEAGEDREYVMTQLELSSALQNLCLGYLSYLSERPPNNTTSDLLRQNTNLDRRFKWTIFPGENPPPEREIFRFDFTGYQHTLAQMKERAPEVAQAENTQFFSRARVSLLWLCERTDIDANILTKEALYSKFLRSLVSVCDSMLRRITTGDSPSLGREEAQQHQWFPVIPPKKP